MSEHWQQCVAKLRQEIPEKQFNTWIAPITFIAFSESDRTLKLALASRIKLDMVKTQFSSSIAKAWHATTNSEASIELAVMGVPAQKTAPVSVIEERPTEINEPAESLLWENTPSVPEHVERAKINPSLSFTAFVTGKANQMARAAASQVAEHPGTSYNPLYIHGGVGLGKTHLLHAVGNALLARKPKAKVRYLHAEQYVRDVVAAYQRKAFDEFKRYYHSLDLLLIDDIQFFEGKKGSQEEFFYTFEALINAHKQIIITSDTYPQSLEGIDERLVSRFASGLNVGIEVPDFEMRVAIVQNKAESSKVSLPEDVAFFIAKNLRQNVRELEGALRKVLAYSQFNDRPISLDLTKEALKDILVAHRAQITLEFIQKTVADYYKIKVADMYSKRRPSNIAKPRQIAMYFAKELTQKSLPEIGESFGGRDHTTVLHAVRKITKDRQLDSQLNHELHVLEQTLKA